MSSSKGGRDEDREGVAGSRAHEVRYEADKEGVSKDLVKDTIKEIGNSRKKIENELDRMI